MGSFVIARLFFWKDLAIEKVLGTIGLYKRVKVRAGQTVAAMICFVFDPE